MYTSALLSKYNDIEHGFIGRVDANKQTIIKDSVILNQIHGSKIVIIKSKDNKTHSADASITKQKNLSLAIKSADCIPILMYNSQTHTIAAVHAGWKGTLSDIAGNVARELATSSATMDSIFVAFGPSIGPCCYQVDQNRAMRFSNAYQDPCVVTVVHDRYYINLMWANVLNLTRAGIKQHQIDVPLYCTNCQKDKFYSYRGGDTDSSLTNRNISYIKRIA